MNRPFILCIDPTVHFRPDRWKPLLAESSECEIVDSASEALDLASRCNISALVIASHTSAVKVVMHLRSLRAKTPVVLFPAFAPAATDSSEDPCSIDLPIESVSNMNSLLEFLRDRMASSNGAPLETHIYRLAPVRWPVEVLADRNGKLIRFEGYSITVGQGGMFGKVFGSLIPGERVLIDFPQFAEVHSYRAQIRCRNQDVYGFVFDPHRNLTHLQQPLQPSLLTVGTEDATLHSL